MDINWYPGHMAKAKRQLAEQLGRVDVVIELCDARLPYSSRNPDLDKLLAGKQRILLLNKADLAQSDQTSAWLNYFRRQGVDAMSFVSTGGKVKDVFTRIENASREKLDKAAQRGMRTTIRAMVVGVPNVGKSTFTNRLHGGNIARVGDRPGVTRANQWVKVTPYLELLDTPGLLWPRLDDKRAAQRLCYIGTVKDDVVDLQMLAICLLEDLMKVCPDQVAARYKLKDLTLKGVDLLEGVCRGRGFLMKGNVCDMDRGCAVVLDEFRSGKLGRMTLEVPADTLPKRMTLHGAGAADGGEKAPAKEDDHGGTADA